MLYTSITDKPLLEEDDVKFAIDVILAQHRFAYQALIYQLTAKQKQVLTAIALEGKPSSLMSQDFCRSIILGQAPCKVRSRLCLTEILSRKMMGYFSYATSFWS